MVNVGVCVCPCVYCSILYLCVHVCNFSLCARAQSFAWSQLLHSQPPLNKHSGLNAHSPGVCRLTEVVHVGTEEGRVVRKQGKENSGRKREGMD